MCAWDLFTWPHWFPISQNHSLLVQRVLFLQKKTCSSLCQRPSPRKSTCIQWSIKSEIWSHLGEKKVSWKKWGIIIESICTGCLPSEPIGEVVESGGSVEHARHIALQPEQLGRLHLQADFSTHEFQHSVAGLVDLGCFLVRPVIHPHDHVPLRICPGRGVNASMKHKNSGKYWAQLDF